MLATRGLAGAVTAAACLLLGLSLLGTVGSVRLRETDERRRREIDHLLHTQEEWLLAFGRRQVLQMRPIALGTVVASLHDILYRVIREDITLTVRAGDGGSMSSRSTSPG